MKRLLFGDDRANAEVGFREEARQLVARTRAVAMRVREARGQRSSIASIMDSAALMIERSPLNSGVAIGAWGSVDGLTHGSGFLMLPEDLRDQIQGLATDLRVYADILNEGVGYGGVDLALAARKVAKRYRRELSPGSSGSRVSNVIAKDGVVTIVLDRAPVTLTTSELAKVRGPGFWGQRRGVETRIIVGPGVVMKFGGARVDLVAATGAQIRRHVR